MSAPDSTDDATLDLLTAGELEVKGRMPYSSNATFLAEVTLDGTQTLAVYKPGRGERRLHDFPPGLFRRELAAYLLAVALGWEIVPETVVRDGPLGEGSVQAFIDADFSQHYFTLVEDAAHHRDLQRICLFDIVANSTDRKSGHCLLDDDGRIWAIDNGLSFHHQFKLRTVIWDWAGEPLPDPLREDLDRFAMGELPDELARVLDPFEAEAVFGRTRALLRNGCFPVDPSGMRYPWPLV